MKKIRIALVVATVLLLSGCNGNGFLKKEPLSDEPEYYNALEVFNYNKNKQSEPINIDKVEVKTSTESIKIEVPKIKVKVK